MIWYLCYTASCVAERVELNVCVKGPNPCSAMYVRAANEATCLML